MYVKGTKKPGELSYEQVLANKDIKDMSEAERYTRDVGSSVLSVCCSELTFVTYRPRNSLVPLRIISTTSRNPAGII